MSDFPKTYVKGDRVRVAQKPADAVALEFEGYKLQQEKPSKAKAESAPERKADKPASNS